MERDTYTDRDRQMEKDKYIERERERQRDKETDRQRKKEMTVIERKRESKILLRDIHYRDRGEIERKIV